MQRRDGFTLIEMLVAMTLTVFVMIIVSSAFVTGLETFRQLKGIGGMQSGLRTASNRLRLDLQADHFDGKKRLSDPLFWSNRPREGFFHIRQGSAPVQELNGDLDGLQSYRSVDHELHFSIKLKGNDPGDFMTAQVPSGFLNQTTTYFDQPSDARYESGGTLYHSQWAEIAYYLGKTGTTNSPNDPNDNDGTPLYSLYRLQRIAVPRNDSINAPGSLTDYQEMSCISSSGLHFITPAEMADTNSGNRKRSYQPGSGNASTAGAALLLQNVITFDVQIMKAQANPANQEFEHLAQSGSSSFDTANSSPGYRIVAIQVVLRVWDQKTKQTRQVTIVQDL